MGRSTSTAGLVRGAATHGRLTQKNQAKHALSGSSDSGVNSRPRESHRYRHKRMTADIAELSRFVIAPADHGATAKGGT